MADGTEQQAPDGPNADSPEGANAHYLSADPERVARIVAALRKAHAEEAEAPEAPAPRRASTGVRSAKPSVPTLRWNPGARYRASRLADVPTTPAPAVHVPGVELPVPQAPATQAPVPLPPVPQPPVPQAPGPQVTIVSGVLDAPAAGPGPAPHPVPGAGPGPVPPPPPLAWPFRGPARRTAVFEREIWHPVTRSSRVPRDVSEALVAAVERYRKGSISTTGLVRAIGKAHAA